MVAPSNSPAYRMLEGRLNCGQCRKVSLAVQVVLVMVILVTNDFIYSCAGTSYEVVKSPLYPNFPAGTKSFRDPPIHGPVVALQVWYSDSRVLGLRTTFLDKHKSPIHGYPVGNTSTVTFNPLKDELFIGAGLRFGNTGPDGAVGAIAAAFVPGTLTGSPVRVQTDSNQPVRSSDQVVRVFGTPLDPAAAGYGTPGVVVGLTGSVDHTGLTQLGTIIEAPVLSFNQRVGGHGDVRLFWPKEAVVRSKAIPRLPDNLVPFDDGVSAEHGEVVSLQVWSSAEEGVLGIQSTFEDGYTSPVHGSSHGESVTLKYDPKSNPLIAVGGRGAALPEPDNPTEVLYRLSGLAFYAGGSSPPVRSSTFGIQAILTYSDSADGKIVGFFGQLSSDESQVIQLGVHIFSPANGLLVSSGPFPRVSPPTTVPFDHTGDNIGVSKIDVYYDRRIGVRGLRVTYAAKGGIKYTTPVYGRTVGIHKQVQFDYVSNPLVNVGVYIANVLAGTGEIGVVGMALYTLRGDFIGTFGVYEFYSNITDGGGRVVGFHGQANTVVNTLGVYTAPL